MLAGELRTSAFDELRRGLSAKSRKALRSAFSSEAYRLTKLAKAEVRGGVGESREPLSRKLKPAGREKALAWLAPLIGYVVRPLGAGFRAVIGPSGQTRRRPGSTPPSREVLEGVVHGGRITITPRRRRRIAAALKRKRKHPPRDLANRKSWGVPAVGKIMEVPRRDWVTPLARRELPRTLREIARKYALKLQGKRF